MPTRAQIIQAMQFTMFYDSLPVNTTGSAREVITYQFETGQPADMWHSYSGWTALTPAEKNAVRAALAHIETFLNVDFVEAPALADPDLNLGKVNLPAGVLGMGSPSVSYTGGVPHTIIDWGGYAVWDTSLNLATDGLNTILHELGHALGLKHPFEPYALPGAVENNHYTVMSYTADPFSAGDPDGWGFNDAMMLYDILALQNIWGAAARNTGNTTYTGPTTGNVQVVWDSKGYDTFDASASSHGVTLDLRQGAFSSFGDYPDLAIAFNVRIERALGGSGGDTITGNAWFNRLFGGAGNDTIYGLARADWLFGGTGDDTLHGGLGFDRLFGGDGADSLAGNAHPDRLAGGDGNDALDGGGGNDVQFGGTGDDTLAGGAGFDRIWGGPGADVFLFRRGANYDVVRDFENDVDSLRIEGFGPLSAVLDAARTVNGDTIFDFGSDVLVVRNATLAELTDDLIIV